MDTKVFKRSEILGKLTKRGFAITDGMLSCICEMIQEAGGTFINDSVNNTVKSELPFDTIENAVISNFPVYKGGSDEESFIPKDYFNGLVRTEKSRNVNALTNNLTITTLPIYWEENDNLIGIGMVSNINVQLGDSGRRLFIRGQVKLNNNPIVQRLLSDKRIEPYSNMFGIEPSLMTLLMVDESLSTLAVHGIIVKAKTVHDYFLPDHNAKDKKPIINYEVGLFTKAPFTVEWNKVENSIEEAIVLKQNGFTVNKDLDISIRKNVSYGTAIPTVGGYLCLLNFLGKIKPKFTIKTNYIFVSME